MSDDTQSDVEKVIDVSELQEMSSVKSVEAIIGDNPGKAVTGRNYRGVLERKTCGVYDAECIILSCNKVDTPNYCEKKCYFYLNIHSKQ